MDLFYDLPDTKSIRATSLGKGNRHDFVKDNKNGSDNFYNITKEKAGPSYSFGISRDCYQKVFLESNKIKGLESPGPGKYSFKSTISGDKSPKYSMGQKFKISNNNSNKLIDSPFLATLKLPTDMNPLGKYPVSSCRNATNIIFGYSKEKRFNYKCIIIYFYLYYNYLYFILFFIFFIIYFI